MKIDYAFETKYGIFSDALTFPDDVPVTEIEIEAEKQRCLNAWLALFEAPEPAPHATDASGSLSTSDLSEADLSEGDLSEADPLPVT